MAERKGRKRSFILISSSSSESEDEDDQQDSDSQSEEEEEESQDGSESESEEEEEDDDDDCDEDDDDDEDSVQQISDSTSSDDDDDDKDESESEEEEEEDYNKSSPVEAKSVCERVVCLLKGRRDLQQELSLMECKAYLREHGLRLSGTKAECTERIKEHWRIKDGNGEAIYPRSSFNINCTGDVCKGDVVLFSQKVYEKFDKVTRTGNPLGKRTVAGRIVKESYGAAKQQHTFTVEVLWSKGFKKLPPLFPLLVKGRNLYKLKTYRQRWKNEAERSKVLDEKHKRGAAARLRRAMKKSKNISSHTSAGAKCHNDFNHNPSRKKQRTEPDRGKHVDRFKKAPGAKQQNQSRHKPSQMKQRTKPNKGKSIDKRAKAPVRKSKSNDHRHETHQFRQANFKQHQSFTNLNEARYHTFPSHSYHAPHDIHHQRAPLSFPSADLTSSSSMMIAPQFRPYANSSMAHFSEPRGFNHGMYPHHAYVHSTSEYESRNCDIFYRPVNNRPPHPFPVRREMHEQRRYGFL